MYEIRDSFVSRYGKDEGLLVEVDFRQLEVCALAELSCDAVLIKELNSGVDIHRMNAAMWLDKEAHKVSDKERKYAKILSFQLQYGAKPPKMAETLGITVNDAASFVENYYRKYHGIKSYHDSLILLNTTHANVMRKQTEPEKERLLITCPITSRKYSIPSRMSDSGEWYFSKTETKNYPVQGFATADIVPTMLNLILSKLAEHTIFLAQVVPINTVHDSFMFDCKAEYLHKLLFVIEDSFKNFPAVFEEMFAYVLKVEYNYDVTIGSTWNKKTSDSMSREDVQEFLKKAKYII